jgi:hypothetical protein
LDPEKRDIRLSKIAELPGLDSDLFRVGRSRRADTKIVRGAAAWIPVVELIGIEPTTSGLQSPRSPS